MIEDIIAGALAAADGVTVAPSENDDPSIVVGNTYQTGAGVVDRYQTLSQLQTNILSWAGQRSPQYQAYVKNMVDAGFLPESAVDQPTTAADNLRFPVRVFQAYRASGGQMAFNEWFDWYASTARAQRTQSGGGGGGFAGPTMSITRQNEADIRTSADNISRDVIGRGLRKKESEEAIAAIREAESQNPTISRVSGQTRINEEGLTAEERRQILQDVVKDNPEFMSFQFDTTVLDAMNKVIEKGQVLRNG